MTMTRLESCIAHPPYERQIEVRQGYLALCASAEHPHCAAALLSLFEHWTNFKIVAREQDVKRRDQARTQGQAGVEVASYWVRFSLDDIKAELFQLFGETVIKKSLIWLEKAVHFIATRNNRRDKWDRTIQYLFRINIVQKALKTWSLSDQAPQKMRHASMSYFYDMESLNLRHRSRKSTEAITQESSLSSNEDKERTSKSGRKKASRSGEKKPVKRSDNFITIAREFFQVFDVDVLDETGIKRINILVGWLKKHSPGATVVTLLEFCKWYDRKFNKAARPRDVEKFAEHFAAFKTQHQNPGTMQANDAAAQKARLRELQKQATAQEHARIAAAAAEGRSA